MNSRGRFVAYGASSGTGASLQTHEVAMRGLTVIGALGIVLTRTPRKLREYAEFALAEAAAGEDWADLSVRESGRGACST